MLVIPKTNKIEKFDLINKRLFLISENVNGNKIIHTKSHL